jgi:hypothetical protein
VALSAASRTEAIVASNHGIRAFVSLVGAA